MATQKYLFPILLLVIFLLTITTSTLLVTPSDKKSVRLYGQVNPISQDVERIQLKTLKNLKISTSREVSKIVTLSALKLHLYSLPNGNDVKIDNNTVDFDQDGNLSWDFDINLEQKDQFNQQNDNNDDNNNNHNDNYSNFPSGILADAHIFFSHIENTDDKYYFSTITFTFVDINDKTITYEQDYPYHHLKYDDTDQNFDLRYEMYFTQAEKNNVNTNTFYRWSALLFDTTRWKPKLLQLYLVGPLTFTTKGNVDNIKNNHLQQEFSQEQNSITNNKKSPKNSPKPTPTPQQQFLQKSPIPPTLSTLPQLQSLKNPHNNGKEAIYCYINSLEQLGEIDHETGILTFTFTNDIDVQIPYRSALSINCPELYVIQQYPQTTSFNGATSSYSVVSIYADDKGAPLELLDIRKVNTKLFSYVDFPTDIRGEGWIENDKVMSTYVIQYPNHGDDIQPKENDALNSEWTKISLRDKIHTYALPYEIYNATSSWATQYVVKISKNHSESPEKRKFHSKYPLLDIFNSQGITVEPFILQQYSNVAGKSPTIDAVNVFRYSIMSTPMPSAVKVNLYNTDNDNADILTIDRFTEVISGIPKYIISDYLSQYGPIKRSTQFHKNISGKKSGRHGDDNHNPNDLPKLQLGELSLQEQFDLIQFAKIKLYEKNNIVFDQDSIDNDQLTPQTTSIPSKDQIGIIQKDKDKEHVHYGVVPQLRRFFAISESVTFDDDGKTFNYNVNSVLSAIDTFKFFFPRGATYFTGDFSTCKITIVHLDHNGGDDTNKEEEFILPGRDKNGKSKGNLEEIIFPLFEKEDSNNNNSRSKSLKIGESIRISCLNGAIKYRKKQPVLASEYLTLQASLSSSGFEHDESDDNNETNSKNTLNSPSRIDVSLTSSFAHTNLHAVPSLLGQKGTAVTQTTIEFIPYGYYFSIFAMLITMLIFVSLCLLAIFIMPLLACIGIIQLEDPNTITPGSPAFHAGSATAPNALKGSSLQYTRGYEHPVISTANSVNRLPSSGSFSHSHHGHSHGSSGGRPHAHDVTKTTQYGTISTDMNENVNTGPVVIDGNGGKQLKSILKKK